MKGFFVTFRIALGLAGLTLGVVLSAHALGLVPDQRQAVLRGRSNLCESIAISFSTMAKKNDVTAIEQSLQAIKRRNPDIISVAVRRADGRFVVQLGDHAARWKDPPDGRSTETHMFVPITRGEEPWGTVEVLFRPIRGSLAWNAFENTAITLGTYVAVVSLVVFVLFLRRVLRHLDPSRVVPERVRTALDALAEGLLVLDANGRIVLANKAFGKTVNCSSERLLGQRASQLPWASDVNEASVDGQPTHDRHPWSEALDKGTPSTGNLMKFKGSGEKPLTFVVNATPIRDDKGVSRGVLTSFEDVSDLEEKRAQLSEMLDKLRASSEQIRRQNRELERLATRDPLTGCCNRRFFFEQFESRWSNASRHNYPISCVMVDVDHFKSVNDRFGHQAGDTVLENVARVLQATARDGDIVCRYGGEEFVVLLPHIDIDDAALAAERFRQAVESMPIPNLSITVSLGVSATSLGAHGPQEMLEQADKCLYVAKRNGRNQVVRWDQTRDDAQIIQGQAREVPAKIEQDSAGRIPFQAVTALISSLAYRDLETAEHSRRVADLCVAMAEGMMSLSECYVLETAALLHDIGKIGVPDAILLKPGPLTNEEWEVMRRHERIGAEIVEASFNSRELTTIVGSYRAFYGGNPKAPNAFKGTDIPLGARILSIADAYDSMVSDRVYRKRRSEQQACDELRRFAGTQFDPELVERFIQTVTARHDLRDARVHSVSKKAAGSIGRQIERLIAALDSRDIAGLQTLAGRLKSSAGKYGASAVAEKAAHLETALEANRDVMEVLKTANELVDLCRGTQRAFLDGVKSSTKVDQAGVGS